MIKTLFIPSRIDKNRPRIGCIGTLFKRHILQFVNAKTYIVAIFLAEESCSEIIQVIIVCILVDDKLVIIAIGLCVFS